MKRVEVRWTRGPRDERVVGNLIESGSRGAERRLYFEFAPEFLQQPAPLSPFKLPIRSGLIEHRDRDFGPLFGVFDDSLPDGWGRLLMDRFFQRQGLAPATVSELDRLLFLGTRTLGALTYHPPSDPDTPSELPLDLQAMADASREILEGTTEDVLPQLLRSGGSPGGARPKVLVGISGPSILAGENDLPEGYRHWIVKFQGHQDGADVGAVELAYSEMARAAGITMPRTRLFETSRGRFFGVERFDRNHNQRFHVHTLGNLIHSNFRIPSCDYRQLLEVTRILTRNHQDVLEAFRRAVFNVATHNRDDHVKNFAFRWMAPEGWQLAPAYDLVFSAGPAGEHSMTVEGEGRAPSRDHLLRLAKRVGIERGEADGILAEVCEAAEGWPEQAKALGVTRRERDTVTAAIETCVGRLRGG